NDVMTSVLAIPNTSARRRRADLIALTLATRLPACLGLAGDAEEEPDRRLAVDELPLLAAARIAFEAVGSRAARERDEGALHVRRVDLLDLAIAVPVAAPAGFRERGDEALVRTVAGVVVVAVRRRVFAGVSAARAKEAVVVA